MTLQVRHLSAVLVAAFRPRYLHPITEARSIVPILHDSALMSDVWSRKAAGQIDLKP